MSRNESRLTKLGDVLSLRRQAVKVDPASEYANLGLYSFGKGPFPKPPIPGADTSASTLYRVSEGQFIYSRLFAFEGAFAVVPSEMDGWFVSNEYPTFDVDDSKALVQFIRYVICRRATWEELASRTVGMGHRRQRLQPEAFLDFEIELPPLEEQRRVVSMISAGERLARAAVDEAAAARALATALYARLFDSQGWARCPLGEVARLDQERVPVEPDETYRIAGVMIAGRGLFWRSTIKGSETTYSLLHRLRVDQLVYRKLTAWEGPITVVPAEFDGAFLSSEFPTLSFDPSRLLPEFMRFICQMPAFHHQMRALGTGTAERRSRLKPADLLTIELSLPPLEEQEMIAAVFAMGTWLDQEAETAASAAKAIQERLFASSEVALDR